VAHFNAFKSAMDAGFNQYFAKHGDSQVHLWLLCTDPAFRRRGAGTMLCQWGLERGARQGLPVTVLASPMGRRLYQRLGFVLEGSFIVHAEGDTEWLRIWALTYSAERPVLGGMLPAWLTSLVPKDMMRFLSYNLWTS
jgi:predicted acetyltransferase